MRMNIILAILVQGIASYLFFRIGYAKRESELQSTSIQFSTNNKPVMIVEKKGGGEYLATIYSKNQIDIKYLNN